MESLEVLTGCSEELSAQAEVTSRLIGADSGLLETWDLPDFG